MKIILKIIAISLLIFAIGLIGRQDLEAETFEITHTPIIRMP